MKTQTHKTFARPLLALLSIFVLTSLACSIGGLTFNRNSATVEVALDQDQLDLVFNNVPAFTDVSGDQLLKKIDHIELHDGFIRVFGEGTTPEGDDVSGSVDVSIGAQNDILDVEIIAVDIPGISLNDPRIQEANQVLEKELSEVVTETNGEVLFKEANVTGGKLQLKVQINYQN